MGARGWARVAGVAAWLLLCLPMWAIASRFGRGDRWVRRFLAGIARLIGLRITVAGRPLQGPVLYAANHITLLDILALGAVAPVRFIAKSEIEGWGLVGRLARIGGTIFVSRERRGETRAQADRIAEALRGDRPVVLFGEGGTGDGITLLPFRAPLFVSAIEAQAPVQPVAIDYGPGRAALAWPDGASLAREAKKLLTRRTPLPVTLHFLDPLPPTLDRKTLALVAHAAVDAALVREDRLTAPR